MRESRLVLNNRFQFYSDSEMNGSVFGMHKQDTVCRETHTISAYSLLQAQIQILGNSLSS